MFQTRLYEDGIIFERLNLLRNKDDKDQGDIDELRKLNIIYYIENSDIRNYYAWSKNESNK